MTVYEADIRTLIPQRPPMVMIDRLVACDATSATSEFSVQENNPFVRNGKISASGLLENMAQTAAARTGWFQRQNTDSSNKMASIGVIGSISEALVTDNPEAGSTLHTIIIVEHEVLMAMIVKGTVAVNGQTVAQARLKIFIAEEGPR